MDNGFVFAPVSFRSFTLLKTVPYFSGTSFTGQTKMASIYESRDTQLLHLKIINFTDHFRIPSVHTMLSAHDQTLKQETTLATLNKEFS